MKSDEENLCYQCIEYCKAYTHYICTKNRMRDSYLDCTTQKQIIEVEENNINTVILGLECALTKLKQLEENKEFIQFKKQVFNLINKKLEENEKLNGVDTAMYYANKGTLNELKNELKE